MLLKNHVMMLKTVLSIWCRRVMPWLDECALAVWLSKSSDSSDDIFCEIERKKKNEGRKEKKGAKNRMPVRTPTKRPGAENIRHH